MCRVVTSHKREGVRKKAGRCQHDWLLEAACQEHTHPLGRIGTLSVALVAGADSGSRSAAAAAAAAAATAAVRVEAAAPATVRAAACLSPRCLPVTLLILLIRTAPTEDEERIGESRPPRQAHDLKQHPFGTDLCLEGFARGVPVHARALWQLRDEPGVTSPLADIQECVSDESAKGMKRCEIARRHGALPAESSLELERRPAEEQRRTVGSTRHGLRLTAANPHGRKWNDWHSNVEGVDSDASTTQKESPQSVARSWLDDQIMMAVPSDGSQGLAAWNGKSKSCRDWWDDVLMKFE
jgi:hypothetical protein